MVADVGFLLAAAGAITTSVLYMTSSKESHIVVGPSVEAHGGGVSLAGRF